MKNLRKVLAVVLVVVLAFSLTVAAGAKQVTDYDDASSVKYTAAVDLAIGLEIMVGSGGTEFDPLGTFTREQAAKVICYVMLGATTSSSLIGVTSSSFSDVATTDWAAPYIEYCAGIGVINGTGDGTFNPKGAVTGTEFAKMLLVALGYGQKGEYTGSNWEVNVLSKAVGLEILDTGVNYTQPATREEVAKYVSNVLTMEACYTVVYSVVTGTYSAEHSPTKTLGELTFGLEYVPVTTNGISAYKYTTTIGGVTTTVTNVYSLDNVIATSTNGVTVTKLMTVGDSYYKASIDTDGCTYYNNGVELADLAAADVKADVSGAVVKLLDNDYDGKVDKVIITTKTVDYVTGNISVSSTGTVTIPGVAGGSFADGTVEYPEDLAKYDYVLYWVGNESVPVTHIEKAASITGTMTAKTSYNYAIFNGVSHAESGLSGIITPLSDFETYNTESTIWVDDNGNIIGFLVTDDSASGNYLVVVEAAAGNYTVEAKVVLTDGTSKVVTVATLDGETEANAAALETAIMADQNEFFGYTINTDNTYALTTTDSTSDTGINIDNVAKFDGTNTGNASTVFIADNDIFGGTAGTYTVFTGVANAPETTSADYSELSFNSITKYVYIYGGSSTSGISSDNVYIINAASYSTYAAVGSTPAYREYAAIVNGETTTVKVLAGAYTDLDTDVKNATRTGALLDVTYNSSDYITAVAFPATTVASTGYGITSVSSGTMVLGDGAYTYDSSTVVYNISLYGVVTKGTISDLAVDAADGYTVLMTSSSSDPDDLVGEVFVQTSYTAADVADATGNGITATTEITETWKTTAIYTVTLSSSTTADTTITLTNGTWESTISLANVTRTSDTVLTITNGTDTSGYTVTFTTTMTGDEAPAPTLVIETA